MGVPELREEVLEKCDQAQILLAFRFKLDKKSKQTLDTIRLQAETANAKTLRSFRDVLNSDIKGSTGVLGCRVRSAELSRELKSQLTPDPGFTYVPKSLLLAYFSSYPQMVKEWHSLPAHTLFRYDFGGHFDFGDRIEYFLPEMLLYTDMCLAYNKAVLSTPTVPLHHERNADEMLHGLYVRSAILSAFYFVEGFLNGLASDFMHRTLGRELSQKEIDFLTEWDSKRNRESWVKFREKVVHYPKVVLDLPEPPFTETNCKEVQTLTFEVRNLRDALVHSSPRPTVDPATGVVQVIAPKLRSMVPPTCVMRRGS